MHTWNIQVLLERSSRRYYRVDWPDGSFRGGLVRCFDPGTDTEDLIGLEVYPRERIGWAEWRTANEVTRDELVDLYNMAENHPYVGEDHVDALDAIVARRVIDSSVPHRAA